MSKWLSVAVEEGQQCRMVLHGAASAVMLDRHLLHVMYQKKADKRMHQGSVTIRMYAA